LRRNNHPLPGAGLSAEEPKNAAQPKFADQLSGTRHFNVSLSPIESHLAERQQDGDGKQGADWE
jgi:hypothetical protein